MTARFLLTVTALGLSLAARPGRADAPDTQRQATPLAVTGPSPVKSDLPPMTVRVAGQPETKRVWTWVAIGIAGASLASAVVTGSLALTLDSDIWSECRYGRCYSYSYDGNFDNDIKRLSALGLSTDILLGVAGAATVSAIILYFLEPKIKGSKKKPVYTYPTAHGGGAGLLVGGHF